MIQAILKRDYGSFKEGDQVNVVGFYHDSDGARAVVTTSDSFTDVPIRDLDPDSDEIV